MLNIQKRFATPARSSNVDVKRTAEKNRAKKEEVMAATERGIDRYRHVLKNLAKR